MYRSRPAFQIVPTDDADGPTAALDDDLRTARRPSPERATAARPLTTTRCCTDDEGVVRRYGRVDGVRGRRRSDARTVLCGS
jgi:hypothetical protein